MHKLLRKNKKWVSLIMMAMMLVSIILPQYAKASSDPVTLAKWDFSNGQVVTPAAGLPVNLVNKLTATTGDVTPTISFGGGPGANKVPTVTDWTNSPSYWEVSLSTKGYSDITLTSSQRSSGTGPKDFKAQISIDNEQTWIDVPNGNIIVGNATWTTGGKLSALLPSEANDKDLVYVRWVVSSDLSAKNDGTSKIASTGTSSIADIEFKGSEIGDSPDLEKSTAPDANKITYDSYSTVKGDAGAVAGNAKVNLYYGDNTAAGSTRADTDGSFTVNIASPQSKSVIYVTSTEDGKNPSDKVAVAYTGIVIPKTATPIASKISYSSYTNVKGAAGAVTNNATVKLYFDDNQEVATALANADGSFDLTFDNPQSKSVVNIIAQEADKDASDKVAINYTGSTNPNGISPGDVMFSQLYVNGGNSGAFYKTKFFELYNNTEKDIDLNGWSIAYTSATTMNFSAGQPLSGIIKAHGYFLVAGAAGATGADLPVQPDVTTTLNPSGSTGGAIVLAKKKTAVTGVDDPDAIDLLAFTNGTASFKNPLYWGSPISDASIGAGTILRKTNIGSDPLSAYGMGNGWFTKDPSKDFVLNKPSGGNTPEEMVVHNSKFMQSPDSAKISFSNTSGTATITGKAGSVPATSTVKVYVENGGKLASVQQATAAADGSFSLNYQDASNSTVVYVTYTDSTQPTALESRYARIDADDTTKTVTPLSELRKNDDKGFPINFGYATTIEGVATTDNTPDGNVKTNFTIQDDTGAIKVVNNIDPSTTIKAGVKYRIDGHVVFTAGLTQFIPTAIKEVGIDSVPAPQQISINALNESKESKLVTFTGKVTNIPSNGPDYDITVSDDNGNLAIVRVQGSISDIEQDASYSFTGIVSQYKKVAPFTSGYYLLPRNASDIKGQLVLTHTPLKKAYIGIDVAFTAIGKNADSVTLYYKGETDSSYTTVLMESADGKNYNGKILKENVPENKFFYYMEAISGNDKKSVGDAEKPISVDVVEDKDGPEFSNVSPEEGSSIESRYPTISVKLDDPNGVNPSLSSITIDGKDYSSKAVKSETEIKLVLTKDDELSEGVHTVVATAGDKLGNLSSHTWEFTVAKRFTGGHHYRGTTHNHTNISHDAAGDPEQALKDAQKYHYDYFAFSDHSHDIDSSLVNKDTVDHKGMKERTGGSDWQKTKDLAKQYTKNGKFVVFPAFEMTSTTWGHSNVFGTDNFIDRVVDGGSYQKLQNYYSWTLTYDDIVAQFNHPKMSANAFDNFIPYDKKVDKLFTMLEVGNGSGKYSYANAEDKFYSALDLGWHVAPTYGEDNHDATWGQTKKRTVIVASDLSQDSLLDAMKHMRVYMSEDPNFTLDVSANGFYMGSTVDTNTLDFNVSGSDPVSEDPSNPEYSYIKTPSNDNIAKVELITNHGRVIDSYIPKNDTTSFEWKPSVTVAGGQQWFVVKVTQKDGDQIYSAPIWSPAKDVAVNVSNVSTPDGAIIGGVPTTLTAGISNLGIVDIKQVKAKFYYDSIDDTHLIGEAAVDSLPANTSSNASVVWNNPVSGSHNIIVVLSADDGHDLGDNKYEQSFYIKAPLGKTIMIDGTHGNENTKGDTGTYKDNLKLFTTLMKQQGYTIVENSTTLSDVVLKDVSVLMITHPTSAYSKSEIAAITNFVQNGGSLLMTEKSNFGGTNQNLNDILSGVGSSILVNNDGVFDETKEGNFWSTPLTSNFSVRLHPTPNQTTLTDFVPTIEYYSGSSLAKNEGAGKQGPLTDSSTVSILASGNESTFQDTSSVKVDTVKYNVQTSNGKNGPPLENVTGGSIIPVIASEELGKGRIIVSGMNIFNDKQIDQTFSPKGNAQFAVNAVNWLTHLEPKVKSIGDARKLTEGTNVVVEGTVTSTAFFDAVYIQDSTGGIMAFNDVPEGSLKEGDKVRIYGHIKVFENNLELEFGSFTESIVKLGSGTLIEPKVVSTKDSNSEENQGLLIKVKGKVTAIPDETSYIIDDGSGETLVFTDGYIIGKTGQIPRLNIGDTLEAVGLAGKYSEGNRIRVRDARELIGTKNEVDPILPTAPGVNEVTVADKAITGTADPLAKVIATVNGKEIGSATADQSGQFEIKIAKQKAGTKIVVTAIDAAGNESPGTEIIVKDVVPPKAPVVKPVTDADIKITGSTEAEAKVTAKVNGKVIGSATADSKGNFEIQIAKQKAGTKIIVTALNSSDKEGPGTEVIVKDVTPPKAPVVNPVTDADVKITGSTEAGAKVEAKVNGKVIGSATADSRGNFEIKIAKQKAGTKIVVTATDAAKNVSPGTEIVVKGTPPKAPVVDPVKDNSKVITGKAEAGTKITVKAGSKTLATTVTDKNGNFKVTLKSLQKASTILKITATDIAGNTSKETNVIVMDKTPPAKPSVNKMTSTTTNVTGKAEEGSTVYVYKGKTMLGKAITLSNGTFKVKIKAQKRNTILTVYAKDKAGNKSKDIKITVSK